MKLLRFLVSKVFFKNLAIAVGLVALGLFLTFRFLNIYTYHGKYIQVPDLEGYSEVQLKSVLNAQELRYVVIDSVYSRNHEPGTVVDQLPHVGAKVKKHRKIFITMNAKAPEMVLMPELKDVSLRQAKNILAASGLKAGDIIYVHSPYKDLVINQYYDNIPIEPGTKVNKNAIIDLEVGKGLGNTMGSVPDLSGMKLDSAKTVLAGYALNLGVVVEDYETEEYPDSAFVWKQRPAAEEGPVRLGTSVDIWLTLDTLKLMPDSLLIDTVKAVELDF